ncbi:NAD(P)-binding domain-containing protein [Streptomyces sp. NPDC002054]|uniref:NAD(P)-binding domain-containing protein n=1 Tax=Streptomyces sp. NPDC002054 TaxID=3154663 RepID=UPI00333453A5
MTDTTGKTRISLLGLGAMGTALARTWLAAGHQLTVWNRTAAKAAALAGEGAAVAASPAEAVAAGDLIVLCLLDDASVGQALDGVDLAGRDLVNLTTGTPAEGRARAAWAEARGARFVDGGIMAVPPMIGVPEAGGYVFYSGSREAFEAHRAALEVPAGARFVGTDPGFAALYDVALLSAMSGLFAGMTHAYALVRDEKVDMAGFSALLTEWLAAMAPFYVASDGAASEDANLEMQAAGNRTLLRTAAEQGVPSELLDPYFRLMERQVAAGEPDAVALLRRPDGA